MESYFHENVCTLRAVLSFAQQDAILETNAILCVCSFQITSGKKRNIRHGAATRRYETAYPDGLGTPTIQFLGMRTTVVSVYTTLITGAVPKYLGTRTQIQGFRT